MSAVRMVAYGVIEFPEAADNPRYAMPGTQKDARVLEEFAKNQEERRSIREMVRNELREQGLLIRSVVRSGYSEGSNTKRRYTTSRSMHTLWGPETKTEGFVSRPVLLENGTLQECCLAALRFLEPENDQLPTPSPKRPP